MEYVTLAEQLSQSTTDFKLLNLVVKTCIDEIANLTTQCSVFVKRTNPISNRSFENRLSECTAKLIKMSFEIEQRLSTFYLRINTTSYNDGASNEGSASAGAGAGVKSAKSVSVTTDKEPGQWNLFKGFSNKNSVSSISSFTTTTTTTTTSTPAAQQQQQQLSISSDRYALAPDYLANKVLGKKIQPVVEGDERETATGASIASTDTTAIRCPPSLFNCIIS